MGTGFWSSLNVEPNRQHRWVINFNANWDIGTLSFAAKKVSKPSMKIGSITHKYLNHFFNFPGRAEWNDVSITLASVKQPDATQIMDFATEIAGYQLPMAHQTNQWSTISKQKFQNAVGSIDIVQLTANGDPIETWRLYKPFFTEIKYGELDYGNEEIVDIQMTVKYDWASLNGNRGEGKDIAEE